MEEDSDYIYNYGVKVAWDEDLFAKESDENKSKDLLIETMMKKYNITKEDMKDITIVKSKLRDVNIDEILK
jgi:ribosomal protein L12E/L44/L45/RPP1/RPP2